MLGLTNYGFHCLLKAMCKSELSRIDFDLGNLGISLQGYGDEEILLIFQLEQKGCGKTAECKFKLADLGLSRKRESLEDFGGE
jgi:hypothetical protein